jgi:hypothetical protein
MTELPLQLLSINTPKGTVRHLVDVDEPRPVTLCGRNTGVNPRHVFVGTWVYGVGPAESATCRKCLAAAEGADHG